MNRCIPKVKMTMKIPVPTAMGGGDGPTHGGSWRGGGPRRQRTLSPYSSLEMVLVWRRFGGSPPP
jgi:hypothetical protein